MRFSKWHALGNSYLLVERAESGHALGAGLVRRLCDVGTGIGADGVLEIVRAEGAEAEVAIWNPDGSGAEFSGNGTRLAAMWLAERSGSREVVVHVGRRAYPARRLDAERLELDAGTVAVQPSERLAVDGEVLEVTPVSVGNPHAVVRLEATRDDLLRLGPLLERHERFPERTNVQLAWPDGEQALRVLVWERGAGETSASGSSAVAVAAAAVANGWCQAPVTVRMPGGELFVALDGELRATLTGPAVEICRGELTATV